MLVKNEVGNVGIKLLWWPPLKTYPKTNTYLEEYLPSNAF